jgi:succinate dehydrogenase/fumarate reductase flavoprotein subunit
MGCAVAGQCHGVMAFNMEDGQWHRFNAHQTILATGVRVMWHFLFCTA